MAAFGGTIRGEMKTLLDRHAREWRASEAYVGCSGNFTAETILKQAGVGQLHGNDVTLYSSVLGGYLAGQPAVFSIRQDARDEWGWLDDYFSDPEGQVASLMLVAAAMQFWRKTGDYYERMLRGWRDQFERMYVTTRERVEAARRETPLKSYVACDVFDWFDTIPEGATVVTYPPFVGFGDAYVRLFEKLDEIFTWPARPDYELLEDERLSAFWGKLSGFKRWMTGSNQPIEELGPYLRAVTKNTNRAPTLYIYANDGDRALVRPRQDTEDVLAPRLGPHEDIGERLALAPLSYAQFAVLRSQYMNPGIRPGQSMLSIGVVVDGVVVGAFAYAPGKYQEDVYLLSDFPVAPTKYRRLAKLVCIAALSNEARMLAERTFSRRCRKISTTAFTNKPVSMKYRGLFKLAKRQETDVFSQDWSAEITVDSYYRRKFELKYDAEMGRWSLEEGMALWLEKHGQVADHVEAQLAYD
jgi:hypothetical protein